MTDLQRPDGPTADQPAPSPYGQSLPPPPPGSQPAGEQPAESRHHRVPTGPTVGPSSVEPSEVAGSEAGKGQAFLRLGALGALLVLLGVFGSWWMVLVVVLLLVMIFMHELGHYLAAKRAGMKVTEFFIGFGPRVWSFRRGEVEYGIKGIPAGAYVKIIGMSNLEPIDPVEEPRTYRSKSYWSRFCVAVAGSAMHFAMALVLLFAVLAFIGAPKADNWQVGTLSPDSPATSVGMTKGDEVLSVNAVPVETYDDFRTQVRKYPGQQVTLEVLRDGQVVTLTPTLEAKTGSDGETVGFLGIGPTYPSVKQSIPAATVDTFATFGKITAQSITGLGRIFSLSGMRNYLDNFTTSDSGTSSTSGSSANNDRLVSPIGAVSIGAQLASNGWADLLFFFAAVNIFVGLFNLVPLPPFDGGHIAVATYEEVRTRKQGRRYYADVAKLMPVAYLVVGVLMLLFVGNMYLDLVNPVKL